MEPSKNIVFSKTFWFNAISLLVGILTALTADDLVKRYPELVAAFGTIITIGNVVIRYFTTQPIHIVPQPDPHLSIIGFLLLSVSFCGSTTAADYIFYRLDNTYYTIEGQDGARRLKELPAGTRVQIVDLANPTSPPPVDPSNPDPLAAFKKQISTLTGQALQAGATKTSGAAISAVFSLVSDSVGDGTISVDRALPAVSGLTTVALSSQTDQQHWQPWRASVSEALAELQRLGELKTKEKMAAALKAVATSMNSVTGFNGNLSSPGQLQEAGGEFIGNIDIAKFMKILQAIMELIKLFQGS